MAKTVYGYKTKRDFERVDRVVQRVERMESRPKRGKKSPRRGRAAASDTDDDIRAVSAGTISAATGARDGPLTPGFGLVILYVKPTSGNAGTAWQPGEVVTAENWTRGTIPPYKPLPKLSLSRNDDNGDPIYAINAEGCAEIPEEEE